jgi:hypothetical protein
MPCLKELILNPLSLKSNFKTDLKKEQKLAMLLDQYYAKNLKHYNFKRVHDRKRQFEGIDLLFTHKEKGLSYAIDEKAQLDYINEDLPTFAFELSYMKTNVLKKGWFYDPSKQTEFYSLITGIYADAPNAFTSCKITLVNRAKLITYLNRKGVTELHLKSIVNNHETGHGKLKLNELDDRTEGYLYLSSNNKAEQPINLVLRLSFLLQNGLAKRLA